MELPGFGEDLDNMKWFLTSYGGFNKRETTILQDLSCAEIEYILDGIPSIDYLFLYYTGHGSIDAYGQTHLLLTDGQSFPVSSLRRNVVRQLNILDCCRANNVTIARSTIDQDNYIWDVQPPPNDTLCCRRKFNKLITAAPHGEINIFSCSPSERSFSGPRLGSRFTYLLTKNAAAELANGNRPVELTVHDVFSLTKLCVNEDSNGAQNPMIESDQIDFPFAVLV
jgi:hypothetical protein